jgi:hypothetical protein
MFYKQCTLKRGQTSQVAWIPEVFAKSGHYLEILGENGWCVMNVGTRKEESFVLARERDYTKHRLVTDI